MYKNLIKYLFFIFYFFCEANGRENPFLPADNEVVKGTPTNVEENIEDLKKEKFQLPDTARILKSVILNYQRLDGSIEKKEFEISKKIDWHNPLILSSKDLGDFKDKDKEIKKDISKTAIFKPVEFLTLEFNENKTIIIKNSDRLSRDFIVLSPNKIILDFHKKSSFYTKHIETNIAYCPKFSLGNHNDFYRIALETDGRYGYEIEKNKDGYIVRLK